MNNKGEIGIGTLLVAFIAIIVGLAMLQGTFVYIGEATNTLTHNTTAGSSALTPTASDWTVINTDAQAVSNFVAINATGGETINSGNYTIENYYVDPTGAFNAGTLTSRINASGEYGGQAWNVSYTYEPLGYITSSGGRSIALLIAIFMALAIAVVALVPTLRSGVIDMMGR